jgi:hypothetical protein
MSGCGGMLIDVLFLGIVDAHQGLNRFNHALGITDQVTIRIGRD